MNWLYLHRLCFTLGGSLFSDQTIIEVVSHSLQYCFCYMRSVGHSVTADLCSWLRLCIWPFYHSNTFYETQQLSCWTMCMAFTNSDTGKQHVSSGSLAFFSRSIRKSMFNCSPLSQSLWVWINSWHLSSVQRYIWLGFVFSCFNM